ncbi:MAG TPA: LPS export ABC transporter periplasmic protein LptC [Allosphingosinicella sp.]|jgi:lipopolysaccharide export system protein LptC|nr:LPS export ABC transporter periplasmic protein LptC [Allosphingosinicella sp.]
MSELARRERAAKRGWAAPGGFHDFFVRFLKIVLPVGVLGFLAYLLLSPLSHNKEVSFLLDKKKVATASERLKTQTARYQGVDDNGRPFIVDANQAIQKTSQVPIVDITGVRAQMQLKQGPATATADTGRYHMDNQTMDVNGPIHVVGAGGYKLETRDVTLDLNKHTMAGHSGVEGTMPLGHFTADNMNASLPDQHVTLTGRPHLHIDQGGLKRVK